MARCSVRVALLLLLGVLVTPMLAEADRIYKYGYRTEKALILTPAGPVVVTVPERVLGNGSSGAPLHGLVCSKGTIAELPLERQALYLDGATVGHPGYRCLDFRAH
jgi:hypothetical protein